MRIVGKTGWLLIIVFTLIPVVRWFQLNGLEDFQDAGDALVALGKIAGLVALILYALNFVLATRMKFLDPIFGGLNQAYIAHRTIGGLALITLLLHPLLITFRYIPDRMERAAQFLLPSFGPNADWDNNFGIFSLMLTLALIIATFFVKIPYHKWFKTHQYLGLAFLLTGIHTFMVSSDTSDDTFMRIYALGWIAIGLLAFMYRTLFGKILVRRKKMRVINIERLNEKTTRIKMAAINPSDRIDFEAGQFVFVRFKQAGLAYEFHPFSITAKKGSFELEIIVKSLGDFTTSLVDLQVGAIAEVEGAFGKFGKHIRPSAEQTWIAGGIGVTPFLSLAKSLEDIKSVDLFYVIESFADMVEYYELLQIAANSDGKLNIYLYPTYIHGKFFSGQYVIDNVEGKLQDRQFLMCGPPPMMNSLQAQLKAFGVPAKNIHTEEFALL